MRIQDLHPGRVYLTVTGHRVSLNQASMEDLGFSRRTFKLVFWVVDEGGRPTGTIFTITGDEHHDVPVLCETFRTQAEAQAEVDRITGLYQRDQLGHEAFFDGIQGVRMKWGLPRFPQGVYIMHNLQKTWFESNPTWQPSSFTGTSSFGVLSPNEARDREFKVTEVADEPKRPRCLVLDEVAAERTRQDQKWGGAEHDDGHDANDWTTFINDYAGWARRMADMGSADKARRRFIQVAALAVAAVESIDRRGV